MNEVEARLFIAGKFSNLILSKPKMLALVVAFLEEYGTPGEQRLALGIDQLVKEIMRMEGIN